MESLQLKVAAEKAITEASAQITPIKMFATSFNALATAKGSAIRVPVFSIGDAGEFNKTSNNYAGTTQDVEGVDVILDKHLVKSVFYTDVDMIECDVPFFEKAGEGIAKSLARGIVSTVMGQITEAGGVTNKVVMPVADFLKKNVVANLYAEADKAGIDPREAVLVLSPTTFSNVLSLLDANIYGGTEAIKNGMIPNLYGFRGIIMSNVLPTDAVNGAIVHTEAIGIAGRYLQPDASAYAEIGSVTDDSTGLTLGFRRFADPRNGDRYLAGEVLFGTKVIQPEKIVRIVNA